MIRFTGICALLLLSSAVQAGDKVEAAIGGGVGGAVGAVIGEELGDRQGAIIGAGVGAAVGAAIATDDDSPRHEADRDGAVSVVAVDRGHPGRHCPPGQAKKGRC